MTHYTVLHHRTSQPALRYLFYYGGEGGIRGLSGSFVYIDLLILNMIFRTDWIFSHV